MSDFLVAKFLDAFLCRVRVDLGLRGECLSYLSCVFLSVYPVISDEVDCKSEFVRLIVESDDVYGLSLHVRRLELLFSESLLV